MSNQPEQPWDYEIECMSEWTKSPYTSMYRMDTGSVQLILSLHTHMQELEKWKEETLKMATK